MPIISQKAQRRAFFNSIAKISQTPTQRRLISKFYYFIKNYSFSGLFGAACMTKFGLILKKISKNNDFLITAE